MVREDFALSMGLSSFLLPKRSLDSLPFPHIQYTLQNPRSTPLCLRSLKEGTHLQIVSCAHSTLALASSSPPRRPSAENGSIGDATATGSLGGCKAFQRACWDWKSRQIPCFPYLTWVIKGIHIISHVYYTKPVMGPSDTRSDLTTTVSRRGSGGPKAKPMIQVL